MGSTTDSRGSVDGNSVVSAVGKGRAAGMNPDPDAHLRAVRPRVRRQCPRSPHSRENSIARGSEDEEKSVALRIDLFAASRSKCVAEQAPVVGQHLG